MWRTTILAAILAAGTGACTAPAPAVHGVEPDHGDCSRDLELRVQGYALGPEVQIDLSSGTVGQVAVIVGGARLESVQVADDGSYVDGTLRGGALAAGSTNDVTVQTARGHEASLPGAFRCDGTPPPDAGDEGGEADADARDEGAVDVEADVEADAEAEADTTGPVGPVVTASERGSIRVGSAPTVAWVAGRWAVAFVEDDPGGAHLLRLAEIPPGGTDVERFVDVDGGGDPADPVIRALGDAVWLVWVDRVLEPHRYRYRLLDESLAVREAGGTLGVADDALWRRDHDVVRDPDAGLVAVFSPVTGGVSIAVLDGDGALTVRPRTFVAATADAAEVRAAWADGAFRVVWWEDAEAGAVSRGAAVGAAGSIVGDPVDLALEETAASPVPWVDGRGGAERLFLCYEAIPGPMDVAIRHLYLGLDFAPATTEATVSALGWAARCAAGGGLLAWSVLNAAPTVEAAWIGADGSTERVGTIPALNVRAVPGPDLAAGPDRSALVWLEDRVAGEPVAVRFAEVRPEP